MKGVFDLSPKKREPLGEVIEQDDDSIQGSSKIKSKNKDRNSHSNNESSLQYFLKPASKLEINDNLYQS
jgi:hypothetical protein